MRFAADDIQIASLFALIVLFTIAERRWPAHPVDKYKDLKLDVLSFGFALAVNRGATYLVRGLVGDVTPRFLHGTVTTLQSLPSALRIVVAIFVADFIIYWIHRSQHTFEVLWRTHKWHHSIEEMYWF